MSLIPPPAAALDRVTKRYGATVALDEVSLRIEREEITALLGPNGAGKTTAIALLLGLTSPQAGRVELLGDSPRRLSARRRVGVMLQSAGLPDTLRVGELLRLVASYYPRRRSVSAIAELAGVSALLPRLYGRLSGGQQRRVQLALALCGEPELLFLDEPTTGLDTEAREAVWNAIRLLVAGGCAVLLTTHYLEEAEALAQQVIVLARGKTVASGTVDEIRALGVIRRIRCISRISPAEVGTWPGVSRVSHDARWLHIEATQAEPIVRRLLDADPDLSELEIHRTGLAEALLQITRGAA